MTSQYNKSEFQVVFTQIVSKIHKLLRECLLPDRYIVMNNGKYQYSEEAKEDLVLIEFNDRCNKIRKTLQINDLEELKNFETRDAVRYLFLKL